MSLQIQLFQSTVVTANGNTGTVPSLPYNVRGALFNVNVTASSGTNPILAISLQWQDPITLGWVTLATMSNITGNGATQAIVYPGAASPLYNVLPSIFRLSWVVGGTTPSFTFSIGANYLN